MASITLRALTGSSSGATTKNSALTILELDTNFDNINLLKLEIPSSNGIVARTGTNVTVGRTLTAGSSNISITNGDGVSGNPTIDLGTSLSITSLAVSSTSSIGTVTSYAEQTASYGTVSAATINLANGTIHTITTSGTTTITLPAASAGKSFIVVVTYGASGTDNITWAGGSTIKWNNGAAPVTTKTAGKIDIFSFFQDSTTTYGSQFGKNF